LSRARCREVSRPASTAAFLASRYNHDLQLCVVRSSPIRCQTAVQTGLVVAEGALSVQAAIDAVRLIRGHRPAEPVVHLGYVLVSVALLPLLVGLSGGRALDADGPRMGFVVVALACAVCVVIVTRMHATWN